MNMFRGPLKTCFGVMGVRSGGAIRCQLNNYKHFSVNNCMQRRNKNESYGLTELFDNDDFEESTDNMKNSESQSVVNNFNKKTEQDKNLPGGRNQVSLGIFGSNNFNERIDKHVGEEEQVYRESKSENYKSSNKYRTEKRPMKTLYNDSETFSAMRQRTIKKLESFDNKSLKSTNYENHADTYLMNLILEMSAVLPLNSPILRNEMIQSDAQKNVAFFQVSGSKFLSAAYLNQVNPLKIFYSNPSETKYFKFNPYVVEYYLVSKTMMLRNFFTLDTFAIFRKDSVIEKANSKNKDFPVSVVVHNIQEKRHLNEIVNDASHFGCEKLMSTYGSLNLYTDNVINQNEYEFFNVPIYDQVHWDKIESLIDQYFEIFLINPDGKSSSNTRKKPPSIPHVDMLSSDIWTKRKILLIVSDAVTEEDEELSKFCKKWNVKKLISTNLEGAPPFIVFTGILGEIKRQHYHKFLSSRFETENDENERKIANEPRQ